MAPIQRGSSPVVLSVWDGVLPGVTGLWLALALVKWGNPVILDYQVPVPANWAEVVLTAWPVSWGYALLVLVFGLALGRSQWKSSAPTWLLVMPVAWLVWQFVSATQTVNRALTAATLLHFSACVAAFFLGHFALNRVGNPRPFWLGLLGGFFVVLVIGWRQHFGGLDETRRFFFALPDWQTYPAEFLKKLSSDRIYSTLFYPNTLASVVVLLMPVTLTSIWSFGDGSSLLAKSITLLVFGALGMGCLYWSGSKAGWLIALSQGVFALTHLSMRLKLKIAISAVIISSSLGILWFKHHEYFGRGSTSAQARFEYWHVAWDTLTRKPLFGTGPGTFMVIYRDKKPPDAEMTRLAHNDFLQQGSDSGWPGFLTYSAWIVGSCYVFYRKRAFLIKPEDFAVLIGLVGVIGQGCVEFGLYVPAVAWTTCCLLGWLIGRVEFGNRVDKPALSS